MASKVKDDTPLSGLKVLLQDKSLMAVKSTSRKEPQAIFIRQHMAPDTTPSRIAGHPPNT